MKYLRHLMLALLLGLGLTTTAQVTISSSDLEGTKWKVKDSNDGSYDEYTKDKEFWWCKDGTSCDYPYYLSDQFVPIDQFDSTKVGKPTTGCYYVFRNDAVGFTMCCEIQKFDKEKGVMVLKVVTPDVIGGGTETYELIK